MSQIDRYKGKFELVATGDSLIFQKISLFKSQGFLDVRDIIKNADAAFNNFETIIPGDKGVPRYKRDATAWMTSPRYVLDELKWMGFNLFSLANNHSMDYSEPGLIETIKAFDEAGVVHAGTGRNLSDARRPSYLNTEKARLSLIAIDTSDNDGPAGESLGIIPGRSGINPLRYETIIRLPESEFNKLNEVSRALDLPDAIEDKLNFLGHNFEVNDVANVVTKPYEPDRVGNLRSISQARKNSDFVIVSIHNHIKRRLGRAYFDDKIEYLSEFVEIFARDAIDAGADVILGHGHHCLNGIEIYNGCPIFYGLGNFISQSYDSNPKPYDWYEARGLHEKYKLDENEIDLQPSLSGEDEKRKIRRLTTSVIANIKFNNEKAEEVLLYPIELIKNDIQGGRPSLAKGSNAEEILDRLSRLSADYGTKMKIEKGIGKIII